MHTVALANRRLESCPPELWDLTSTRRLLLSRNKLTCVPDALRALTALRLLDVSSNEIHALPRGITALASLTRLAAQENYIESVPASLARLTQLRVRSFCRVDMQLASSATAGSTCSQGVTKRWLTCVGCAHACNPPAHRGTVCRR